MKRLMIYDLKNGIAACWKRYVLVMLFAIMTDSYCLHTARGISAIQNTNIQASWLDYMVYMFHGMKKYVPAQNQKFEIPIVYIGLGILLAFLIGDYVTKDLQKQGMQVLIRSESRLKWIACKIIWSILVVICFYGILFFINAAFALGRGGLSQQLFEAFIGTSWQASDSLVEITGIVVIMPLLTGMAFVQIQMLVSLVASPVIGFFTAVTVEFVSAYIMSPVLIGNYAMLQRYSIFINDGMHITMAVMIDICVILICILLQVLFFRRKSLLI